GLGIESVELAGDDEGEEVRGGVRVVVGAEEEPGLSTGTDRRSEGSLAVVVRERQAPVFEEPAERLLLPHGVAEGGRHEATYALDAFVLALGPREEVVNERAQVELSAVVPLLRRKTGPPCFQLEDRAKSKQTFARRRIFGDGGGLPEPPAAVGETADFGGSVVVRVHAGFAAEQGVVDRVRVGLDVSAEAPE